jgi:hypothetical protein
MAATSSAADRSEAWGDGSRLTHSRLASPRRITDHTTEIATVEVRLLVSDHIRFHITECRVRLVSDPIVERLDDVFLEMCCSREGLYNSLSFLVCVFVVRQAEYIHLNARGDQRDDWMHVDRHAAPPSAEDATLRVGL